MQLLYYFEQFRTTINPHRDIDIRKDKFDVAQIAGTDVIVISMGADMTFKLISPDVAKGQNHNFTQAEAWTNAKRADLTEDITLSDMSVYIHTAHDDALLQHMASFSPIRSGPRNRVRLALACRSLGISNTY